MRNFAYRQVLKELNINGLGPTAHTGPSTARAWQRTPRRGQDRMKPHGAGGTVRSPTAHALQASNAPFLVDEEIVAGAQEFVFV